MIDFTQFPSPCYIMEEELLRKNLSLIKSVADDAGVEIILAFKSFAMWRSFPIFREYIGHSTASSVYEARLALEEFGSKAHTYSPAYTEADFPEIMRCSSHITFNSLSQFSRFYPLTVAEGSGISCGIRVNPEYSEVETELYNPCAPGTRSGSLPICCPPVCRRGSKVSIVIAIASHLRLSSSALCNILKRSSRRGFLKSSGSTWAAAT